MSELPIKRSEQIGELFAALAKAQLNYKTVVRTHENTYTNSKYADLQDLIDATQPALATEGLTIIQFPIEDLDRKRAGAFSMLSHSSGQFISTEFWLPAVGKASGGAEKLDAHTITAAVTYAKRTTYSGIAGIVGETEDDGNSVADHSSDVRTPEKLRTVKPPSPNQSPAKTGGERPNQSSGVKLSGDPIYVRPRASQQGDLPLNEDSPIPKAQITPEKVILSDTPRPESVLNTLASMSSQIEQADIQPDTSALPVKSQFDTYVARVRDEVKPALEKAGLKPSKGLQTGAKLKNFILSVYGNPGAKELTDLTIRQWDAFLAAFASTDAASFALKVEEANKK